MKNSSLFVLLSLLFVFSNALATSSFAPTTKPSAVPSKRPTQSPTKKPSAKPTASPSVKPVSVAPSSKIATAIPSSRSPSVKPTISPSTYPSSRSPTKKPSRNPTTIPSTKTPSVKPTRSPSASPSSNAPSAKPSSGSKLPTAAPSMKPSTVAPKSRIPSAAPSSRSPTSKPSTKPTAAPSVKPTTAAPSSRTPTVKPSSRSPSAKPSFTKSTSPSIAPRSAAPLSRTPSAIPSSRFPTAKPTSRSPSARPTTSAPSKTKSPSRKPSEAPSQVPSFSPSVNVGNIYNAYVAKYMKNTVGAASNSNWRTNFVDNFNFIRNYTSFYSQPINTLGVQGSFNGPAFTMGITKFMHLSNDEYRVATGINSFYQYYQDRFQPTARPSPRPTGPTRKPVSIGNKKAPTGSATAQTASAASGPSKAPTRIPTRRSEKPLPPSTSSYRVGGFRFQFDDDDDSSDGLVPVASPTEEPASDCGGEGCFTPIGPPTEEPTYQPTYEPTEEPAFQPTYEPGYVPTYEPAFLPTYEPGYLPTYEPGYVPTYEPGGYPPTYEPFAEPTYEPGVEPTYEPTDEPTSAPTFEGYPTETPTRRSKASRAPSPPVVAKTATPTYAPVASSGSVDWTTDVNPIQAPAVAPIKDQGQCGSCWAFSAVGAIEGAVQIKYRGSSISSYSEQQVVDCDKAQGACNGGWPAEVMDTYLGSTGLETDADYPYTGLGNSVCSADAALQDNRVMTSAVKKVANTWAAMKAALDIGPVSVTVAASSNVWQLYNGGVLNDARGCGTAVDHAILAVGYGTDPRTGLNYIKCKNSWGKSWGEGGYVRIWADEKANTCRIYSNSYYPVLK